MVPAEEQVAFLHNFQRLLAEGQFTATYKFALVLALADLAIEQGSDNAEAQEVSTSAIAEKFIQYYWRHIKPFAPGHGTPVLLRQNLGNSPAIITELTTAAESGVTTLAELKKDKRRWKSILTRVRQTVCNQPLRYLPTMGTTRHSFLYDDSADIQAGKVVDKIRLKPGVMFCLRRFYDLVTDLVRGAWVRYARRYNADVLGSPTDLDEFLFGSERAVLQAYVPLLREVQESRCFYCAREMTGEQAHVDHFIPWSLYPVDLGHNFVLAHGTCNSAKADHLAAVPHLAKWNERNRTAASFLEAEFDRFRLLHNRRASIRVAQWAYGRAGVGAMTWFVKTEFQALSSDWTTRLALT
jgi:hypothetical protein